MSEHVLEHLSAYLDGALGAAEKERFRAHLAECASCAKRLEELAFVDASVRDLPSGVPDRYFEGLPSRVRARLSASRFSQRRLARLPLWTLAAAAAALMVGVLAPLTLQERRMPAANVSGRLADQTPAAPGAADVDKLGRAGRAAVVPPATLLPAPAPAASAIPADESRKRADTRTPALRPKAEAARSEEAPLALATPAAPPPLGTTAPAGGFAEPPRPAAQSPQQSGPRVSQQAEARRQAAMKGRADAPAELAEAEARGTARGMETKDAQASAERALVKSDKENAPGRAAGLTAASRPLPSARFRQLQVRAPRNAAEARSLRESWRLFSAEAADTDEADEARVRVIEMGLQAWRFEQRSEDRSLAERDAAAYLERADARQAARVRSLLAPLGR